jgi:hypothetical protein
MNSHRVETLDEDGPREVFGCTRYVHKKDLIFSFLAGMNGMYVFVGCYTRAMAHIKGVAASVSAPMQYLFAVGMCAFYRHVKGAQTVSPVVLAS